MTKLTKRNIIKLWEVAGIENAEKAYDQMVMIMQTSLLCGNPVVIQGVVTIKPEFTEPKEKVTFGKKVTCKKKLKLKAVISRSLGTKFKLKNLAKTWK